MNQQEKPNHMMLGRGGLQGNINLSLDSVDCDIAVLCTCSFGLISAGQAPGESRDRFFPPPSNMNMNNKMCISAIIQPHLDVT